jgi:hypothetical protein
MVYLFACTENYYKKCASRSLHGSSSLVIASQERTKNKTSNFTENQLSPILVGFSPLARSHPIPPEGCSIAFQKKWRTKFSSFNNNSKNCSFFSQNKMNMDNKLEPKF